MFLRKFKHPVHDFAQLFGIVDDSLVRLPDLTLYPAAPFFDTGRAHGLDDNIVVFVQNATFFVSPYHRLPPKTAYMLPEQGEKVLAVHMASCPLHDTADRGQRARTDRETKKRPTTRIAGRCVFVNDAV